MEPALAADQQSQPAGTVRSAMAAWVGKASFITCHPRQREMVP